MDKLIKHIKATFLSEKERNDFCKKCGTTWGYLKKINSNDQLLREKVCINFERETKTAITVEELRPDVDWSFIRNSEIPSNK